MHDIVAHSLSVIIAQADGARYASARTPEVAAQTLGTISSSGAEKPYEIEIFVAEVGDAVSDDQIFRLTFDGQIVEENTPEAFFTSARSPRARDFLSKILTH